MMNLQRYVVILMIWSYTSCISLSLISKKSRISTRLNTISVKDDNTLLEQLQLERERKRLEYIASDIAVRKFQQTVSDINQNTSSLLKGTYDYGFTSKSSLVSGLQTASGIFSILSSNNIIIYINSKVEMYLLLLLH